MEKILISACLTGTNCKYNGKSNYNPLIKKLLKHYELIPVCPEVMGGLSIPRIPSEIKLDKVINKEGKEVTKYFINGSKQVLNIVKYLNIKTAILKENSPSCGVNKIYDGTFTDTLKDGSGILTKLLKEHNVEVYSENDIQTLLDKLNK